MGVHIIASNDEIDVTTDEILLNEYYFLRK